MAEINEDAKRTLMLFGAGATYFSLFLGIGVALYSNWSFFGKYLLWGLVTWSLLVVPLFALTISGRRGRDQVVILSRNMAFVMLILYLSLIQVLCGIGVSLYGYYRVYLYAFSPSRSVTISLLLVVYVTLALGISFFYFRLNWRFTYGLSEIVVGVIVASQRFYADTSSKTNGAAIPIMLAILTAGVYLVVRGADNMHQGLTRDPVDKFGRRFLGWLNAVGQGPFVREIQGSIWAQAWRSLSDKERSDKQ